MNIHFSWHDRKGLNNFRVWKPYPTAHFKSWNGQLWYFNLWKWSIVLDFRKGGFLGYIKEIIWKGRLKNRMN